MAPPSISQRAGAKVLATQSARSPLVMNTSPVATFPTLCSTPWAVRMPLSRSVSLVGKSTLFTVDTSPMGSPMGVVSTSCWTKQSANTMVPMDKSRKLPATPALTSQSGWYRSINSCAPIAAFTFPTPPR